ncbi:RNA helicase [Phycicoccus sp. CSK15P-2]|uniref:DEAD/DEAH box helicase n=1 Tax=Phycicoccus sp. CSK15P-2 TaxID=2807627 RepID=UPI001EF24304|nr:DEAD/DEAH box helicase [Phycicoccus sp. CSK15P-2]
MTLTDRLTGGVGTAAPGIGADAALDVFVEWAGERGFSLYPAQEEAVLALADGAHVVLATPTGSGKSLVAVAAHAQALATGRRSWYTAPIKALVSEKFFALVETFGAENVGMLTGDAAVNPGAPIICATAEVLANHALRERDASDVGLVVMDEFHFYGEPDRGWAWQVPLLLLPDTQMLLMSATLGDTTTLERDLHTRTGRDVVAVTGAERPVPLEFEWVLTSVHETLELLLRDDRAPVYVVSFTQAGAVEQAQALSSVDVVSQQRKAAIKEAVGGFRFGKGFGQTLRRLVLHGIGVHHAGMLPKYRRLVETLAQAGLLAVICGTDTLGVGINVPIRTVLLTSLTKYDGRKQRMLRAREFHQIAGRAGRAGFDTVGYVVVQAPDHVIENSKALAKAGGDPKKERRIVRKKPPEGVLTYNEAAYDRLVSADPEPLQPKMRVTHAMVLNVLDQWEGQQEALHTLLLDNHEDDERRERLVERCVQVLGSLVRAGVVEPDDGSSVADWLPPEPEPSSEPEPVPAGAAIGQEDEPDPPGQGIGSLGEALAAAGLAPSAVTAAGSGNEPARASEPSVADGEARGAPREVPASGEKVGVDQVAAGPIERFLRGDGRRYAEGPFQVAMDLHEGFALNQPLSAFALAALELLDTDSPDYALGVVSVIEATLDDPRPVLMAQQFEARGEAVAAMKADGMEYEERMDALEDVTWPKPLAEQLELALRTYRQSHPWVDPRDLSPKAVVREMFERAMSFGEFTAHHKLARAEGVVLRYLTDAYRALRATVPESARTEELDDLVEWLGEVVRHTDSSLLDEWEALTRPDAAPGTEVRPSTEGRALSANPRALRVMVRQSMFRRVELLALRRYEALAALDGGLPADAWQEAHAEYLTEYDEVGTGPGARGPALFTVDEGEDGDGTWTVTQILDDPEGDHDWRITAELDLAATDEAGEPALTVTAFAPTG